MTIKKKVRGLSPFKKLQLELEAEKTKTREWRMKYNETLEGKLEFLRDAVDDTAEALCDARDRY